MIDSVLPQITEIVMKCTAEYERTNNTLVQYPHSAQQFLLRLDEMHDHYDAIAELGKMPKNELTELCEEEAVTAVTYFMTDGFLAAQSARAELDIAQQIGENPDIVENPDDEHNAYLERAMQYFVRARNDFKFEKLLSQGDIGFAAEYLTKEYFEYAQTRLDNLKDDIEITRLYPGNARSIIALRNRMNYNAEFRNYEECAKLLKEIKALEPSYNFKVKSVVVRE